MHHDPALEVTAGAIPGVMPEVKAGAGAGLIVRVILRVSLRVDNKGPLPNLNLGGGDLQRTGGGARPQERCRELPTRASHFRCGDLARLASLPTEHTNMVVRTQGHSKGEGPRKTCPQDLGLLLYP